MVRRVQLTPYVLDASLVRQPYDMTSLLSGQKKAGTPYVLAPDGVEEPPPPPSGYRTPWLHPFASDSVWNTPVGDALTYLSTSDIRHTSTFDSAGGKINYSNWTDAIYLAKSTDPVATIKHYQYLPSDGLQSYPTYNRDTIGQYTAGGGTFYKEYTDIHVPVDAKWWGTTNTDRKVLIVQPDGTEAIEIHKFYRTYNSAIYLCTNLSRNDIREHGLNQGAIASAISPYGGQIRKWEIDAAAAGNVNAIRHALRISLPDTKLTPGILWPSKSQDSNTTNHTGYNPYGTMMVLDRTVDIESLTYGGLSLKPEAKAICYALQNYGGYVLIRASGAVGLATEGITGLNTTAINNMKDAWSEVLIKGGRMRIVTNGHQVGTLDANRVPVDKTLTSGGPTRQIAAPWIEDIDPDGPWV